MAGRPQGVNQIGEWSLDKRHYGGDYPPRQLQPPPRGANAAARWLLGAWNEARRGSLLVRVGARARIRARIRALLNAWNEASAAIPTWP